MARTDTTCLSEFSINGEGLLQFPQPPGSNPEVTITICAGSKQTTGLHWHETHTEILRVVEGIACIEVDGIIKVVSNRDDVVVVKEFARHQFWRANRDIAANSARARDLGLEKQELERDLVIIEATDPADRDKEVFFRHLASLLRENKGSGLLEVMTMVLSLFVVFHSHDNFPVLLPMTRRLGEGVARTVEGWVTHSVLRVAVLVGGLIGLKGTYDEYTPVQLRENRMKDLKTI